MRRIVSLASLLIAVILSAGPVLGQGNDLQFKLPDDVRRSLSLPRVKEDLPRPPKGRVIEVALLLRDGVPRVFVNGTSRDWPGTKTELAWLANTSRDRGLPGRPSRLPVLLHVDAEIPFGPVEWFLAACALPDVRLPRVDFAVRAASSLRVVHAVVPGDHAREDGKGTRGLPTRIGLGREVDDGPVRLILDRKDLGNLDDAFPVLRRKSSCFDWCMSGIYELTIAPSVPFRDVARLVGFLRRWETCDIRYVRMQPPPAWAAPRWRIPAATRADIALPAARTGEPPSDDARFLEIAVLKGLFSYFVDGKDRTLEQVEQTLAAHSLERRDRDSPLKLSRLRVLVLANADRNWWHVQAVLRACAEPAVSAPDVHLAVKDGDTEKTISVRLPTGKPEKGTAFLTVRLDGEKGKATTVTLKARPFGAGDEGFRKLALAFASIRERYPDKVIHGQVNAGRFVPYRDVVRAVDAFRAAGITNLHFMSH